MIRPNVTPCVADPLMALEVLLGSQSAIGAVIGVGQSCIGNWRMRGTVIPAEYCARLEAACGGRVRRWHMRPTDWHLIWPELIGAEGAPGVPAQAAA